MRQGGTGGLSVSERASDASQIEQARCSIERYAMVNRFVRRHKHDQVSIGQQVLKGEDDRLWPANSGTCGS